MRRMLALVPVKECREGRGLDLLLGNLRRAMDFRGIRGEVADLDEAILIDAEDPVEASRALSKLSGVRYAGTIEVSPRDVDKFVPIAKKVANSLVWRGKGMSVRIEGDMSKGELEDLKFLTEAELAGMLSEKGMKIMMSGDVELRAFVGKKAGYIFYHTFLGFGGYPMGYRSKAVVVLAGGRGEASALLTIRSGFEPEFVSPEQEARDRISAVSKLSDHSPEGLKLFVVRPVGCDPSDAILEFICKKAEEGLLPIVDALGFESLPIFEERGIEAIFTTLHLTDEEAGSRRMNSKGSACGYDLLELYVSRKNVNNCFNELEKFRARTRHI